MNILCRYTITSLIAGSLLGWLPAQGQAWTPNANELDAAINTGDFAGYFAHISTWLGQKIPADPSSISEAALKSLLEDPAVVNTLDQRQLLAKLGPANVGAFSKVDQSNRTFLAWLLRNTQAMNLYLEAVTPTGLKAREANQWTHSIAALALWKKIYFADPDSRDGLYLRLAIATAIAPPGSGSPGAGQAKVTVDPLARYLHFKTAHKNKELFPSFDKLTVWEYSKVVQSGASNEDLAWAREMINTWRPDLRVNELVVNSTSEVWRRNSPISFDNTYKNVITGGGKCGPRSSWSVFVCQAFGIPAIGVGQPAHACVAWKAANPRSEPQPGSAWKVGYGRGWVVSKLDGLSGPEFVEGTEARSRATQFSQVEHLRWLASALASQERARAIMAIARQIAERKLEARTDLAASLKPEEAESDPGVNLPSNPKSPPAQPFSTSAPIVAGPAKLVSGVMRLEAASFTRMGGEVSYGGLQVAGVRVHYSYTGGKQVYFQSNMKSAWTDYLIDVPSTGNYVLVMKTAAVNLGQKFDVSAGDHKLSSIEVPMSTGLWATSQAAEVKLERGIQTLRISAPFQRGVALKWLELKSKDL